MALTSVEICSRALTRLGAKSIQSFSDGTDIATTCSLTYDSVLESELSLYPWRFALKKGTLAKLSDTPTNEYKNAFQLPSDRIGNPFAVFNSASTGTRVVKDYEIFSNKMFTDEDTVVIDYPFKPSPSAFPAYFTEYLVFLIAAQLAKPITDSSSTMQMFTSLAQAAGRKARAADSSQQPPQRIEDFTLIDVRH